MTRPFVLTAVGAAAVVLLAGCGTATAGPGSAPATNTPTPVAHPIGIRPTQSGQCGALSLSLAPGYRGYPTPARAITAFVASGTASFLLPKTGWTTVDHRMYASGTAHLELWHIPQAGYAVTGASNC